MKGIKGLYGDCTKHLVSQKIGKVLQQIVVELNFKVRELEDGECVCICILKQ